MNLKHLLLVILFLAAHLAQAQTTPATLQATSNVILDDGLDHAEIAVKTYSTSHAILFGAKTDYKVTGNIWKTGNTVYASDAGSYSYGAFSMGYQANGGLFNFYDGGLSTGKGSDVTWTPVMTILRGGKIGIGTTSPTSPLHVSAYAADIAKFSATSSGNSRISIANSAGQMNIGIGSSTTLAHPYIWSGTGKFYIGIAEGTPTLFVQGMENGNVGIGTTNPGTYKLAVEGTIGARQVKVLQSSFADYVFEDTYQLPTLEEVEQYIKANKHLPEMPTAAEVEKNGLNLGDNQVLLVKKIEELTLYIIDQQKQIDVLKKLVQQGQHSSIISKQAP
ncbi:MAG: hypothetical protein ACTHMM_13270 [Agriterribacter sp.]